MGDFEILPFIVEGEKLRILKGVLEAEFRKKEERNRKYREENKGVEVTKEEEEEEIKQETVKYLQLLKTAEIHKINLVTLLDQLNKGQKIDEKLLSEIMKNDSKIDDKINSRNIEEEIEKDDKIITTLDMKISLFDCDINNIKDKKIDDKVSINWDISKITNINFDVNNLN